MPSKHTHKHAANKLLAVDQVSILLSDRLAQQSKKIKIQLIQKTDIYSLYSEPIRATWY